MMSFLTTFVFLVLAATMAGAEEVSGPEDLTALLAGRTVVFGERGETQKTAFWQGWGEDGTTETGGPSFAMTKTGHWQVRDGRYCEIFGVSTEWSCWKVMVTEGGDRVQFWEIPKSLGDFLLFHQNLHGYFLR